MQRFLHAQRVVVVLIVVGVVAALLVGLWPVKVDVYGDASYGCGSGFVHSSHTWSQDSQTLQFDRLATDSGTGTPSILCPTKVDNYRDVALLIVASSLAIALIAQLLLERPQARNYRSTLFTNRRRGGPARPTPKPRAAVQSKESSVQ